MCIPREAGPPRDEQDKARDHQKPEREAFIFAPPEQLSHDFAWPSVARQEIAGQRHA